MYCCFNNRALPELHLLKCLNRGFHVIRFYSEILIFVIIDGQVSIIEPHEAQELASNSSAYRRRRDCKIIASTYWYNRKISSRSHERQSPRQGFSERRAAKDEYLTPLLKCMAAIPVAAIRADHKVPFYFILYIDIYRHFISIPQSPRICSRQGFASIAVITVSCY